MIFFFIRIKIFLLSCTYSSSTSIKWIKVVPWPAWVKKKSMKSVTVNFSENSIQLINMYHRLRYNKILTVHDNMGGRLALWYHIYGYGWRYGIISTVPYEQQKIYRQIILFQRIYYLSISLTGLPCHREPSIVLMSM